MSTSSGVVHIDSVFFKRKRAGDELKSARAPVEKVRTARARPMMVRNWKCQP